MNDLDLLGVGWQCMAFSQNKQKVKVRGYMHSEVKINNLYFIWFLWLLLLLWWFFFSWFLLFEAFVS